MVSETPNIILIMTDQQRGDFSKADGFALDTMPFMDSFAKRGARFDRAYTTMPACAPARCSLFTGRFPKATRVRENGGIPNVSFRKDLIEILRERNYSINLSGKNHSYLKDDGFDFVSIYGHTGGGRPEKKTAQHKAFDEWLYNLQHRVSLEPTPFPVECQLQHRIVDDAIECLDNRDERPFFLWVSFPEPHNPIQVSEPYFSLFPEDGVPDRFAGPEACEIKGPKWRWERRMIETVLPGYDEYWRRYRANYCGMIRLIDDQVRRLVGHLESQGLMENTILIFTSDHGDYAGDYGLQRKGVEMPECLVRVPMVIAGPGVKPMRLSEEFVSLADLMPTLCEALGAEIPFGAQGRSLWPMLKGELYPKEEFRSIYAECGFGGLPYDEDETPPLHFPVSPGSAHFLTYDELNSHTQSGNLKMVRMGKWKLLCDVMGAAQLYDLESDPGELNNRYDDPGLAQVRQEMLEELLRWTIRTDDDLPGAKYIPKRAERNWHRK